MCGLTGLLASEGSFAQDGRSIIQQMTSALAHRGPDADGVWIEDGIALGHRRLSVLDLSPAGNQPMQSACRRYVIAFNGEIYNHLVLRRELDSMGVAPAWRGHSDTETLLAGIAQWGMHETLKRAAGMFALAMWDRQERRLYLARDRMGEKPLYWGWAGSSLVFGSELKSLRAHPACSPNICRNALSQYLQFAYVPAPRSIYEGVYKLEPGTILTVEGGWPTSAPNNPLRPGEEYGGISITRYWTLSEEAEAGQATAFSTEIDALTELERVLRGAVERQVVADVPLGAFLSGGIDSSTVVALMRDYSTDKVKTFTIGFDEQGFNEAPHAAAVASHLNTEHTEVRVTDGDARNIIPLLPQIYDEPFADSSQIPTYLVCQAARQNVTVALSGDGADELFGGYNRYFWGPKIWNRVAPIPRPLRRLAGRTIQAIPGGVWDALGTAYATLDNSLGINRLGDKAHRMAQRLQHVTTSDELYRSLVSEWTVDSVILRGQHVQVSSQLDDELPESLSSDAVASMMFQDQRTYLPDDILCKVDRAAMAVSLETRTPFLDPDVISLSQRLPMTMKIKGNTGKWALRQVLYKYVPRALIDRPKAGFAIPVGQWLRGPLREWAEALLAEKRLAEENLFNVELVRRTWQEHLSGRRDWTTRLWIILMFQAWLEAQN